VIFVDTGAFVARYLVADSYHESATAQWERLRQDTPRIVTSNFVLDETLTLLARRAGNSFAAARGRRILDSSELTILRPGERDEGAALLELGRFADHTLSFTDCTSFVLMRERGIRTVFGFDRHFELAGFELIP